MQGNDGRWEIQFTLGVTNERKQDKTGFDQLCPHIKGTVAGEVKENSTLDYFYPSLIFSLHRM